MNALIILDSQILKNPMVTMNWITILSVLIVVAGWFVIALLNRRHEISKERFKYQMVARQSFINLWLLWENNPEPFNDPHFLPLLEETRKNFQLYCTENEIVLLETFIISCENHDLNTAKKSMKDLISLIRTKIRSELKI